MNSEKTASGKPAKRALDLLLASSMLVFCLIPLLAVAVAIKLDDGGRILFRQQRIGRNGKPFRIFKFRTMTVMNTQPEGPDGLHRDDPRITRIGAILRKSGLDELPQLLNVIAGSMSLVGPRPTLGFQVDQYNDVQRRRLEAKPGITSLAVVSGRNALPWTERIVLDVWYIDHWSLWLDISILFRTLWKILVTREGLYGLDGFNDTFTSPPSDLRDPTGRRAE